MTSVIPSYLPTTERSIVPPLRELAALCLISIMLIPVLAVDLPPFVDLLGHMGRYAIQTGLTDHPWLREYYDFRWRLIGNLGADILIQLLHPFAGIETSAKLLIVLNQFLATAGVLLLCREVHGRITVFSLLALPLIYCLPFNFGFINFTMSMALALLAFSVWLRLGRTGRTFERACLFLPVGFAIWLCHTFGWAFLGLLCTADGLVQARTAGYAWHRVLWESGRRCLPLTAPLLPMLLWRSQPSAGAGAEGWFLFAYKLTWLESILRLDNEILDKASAAIIFGVVYVGFRSPRLSRDRTMAAAAALCFLTFLILPARLFGSMYADMRLAPYLMIIALLAIGEGELPVRARRGLMAAAIAFFVARIALTTATYRERERILDAQLEALNSIPERARVATLVSMPCSNTWDLPWLTHIGGLVVVRKHGFANNLWAGDGVNLLTVHYPEAGEFAVADSEMIVAPCDKRQEAMRRALEAVPAGAFTHLWMIGLRPGEHPSREGFNTIWSGPDAVVYQETSARQNRLDSL